MKKLIIIVLLLVPTILSAQETRLINRVDAQTGELGRVVTNPERFTLFDQKPLSSGKSISILLPDSTVSETYGEAHEISADVQVTTLQSVNVIFKRTHLKTDTNMTAGICLCSCYQTTTDSLTPDQGCPLGGKATPWKFSFTPYGLSNPSQPDTIIDYIKLTALTGDPADTVSFILKGIVMPAVAAVADLKQSTTSPTIAAIYPSPLINGNSINVKISSPHETTLSYMIYDGIGRAVGFGATRQHINLGSNTISINSLDGLANGSYTLKLNFGDGSTDTHFFQVMR